MICTLHREKVESSIIIYSQHRKERNSLREQERLAQGAPIQSVDSGLTLENPMTTSNERRLEARIQLSSTRARNENKDKGATQHSGQPIIIGGQNNFFFFNNDINEQSVASLKGLGCNISLEGAKVEIGKYTDTDKFHLI